MGLCVCASPYCSTLTHPQFRAARARLGNVLPPHIRDAVLREQHEGAWYYFQTYPIVVFDRSWTVGSCGQVTKDAKREALGWLEEKGVNSCIMCGTTKNLSAAHILKNVKALEYLGLTSADMDGTNFLCLCGNEGVEGTCRDKFDKGRLSFMHFKDKKWHIIGGERHLEEVTLHNGPHKRSLHTHLAWCVVNGTLDGKDKLTDWFKGLSTTLLEKEMWAPEAKGPFRTSEQMRQGAKEGAVQDRNRKPKPKQPKPKQLEPEHSVQVGALPQGTFPNQHSVPLPRGAFQTGASEQLLYQQHQNQHSVPLQVGALQPGTFLNQQSVTLQVGAFQTDTSEQLQNPQSVSLQVGALQPGTFPNQHSVPLPLGAFQTGASQQLLYQQHQNQHSVPLPLGAFQTGASEQLQNQQSVSLQVGALQPGTFPNQHSAPVPLGAFQMGASQQLLYQQHQNQHSVPLPLGVVQTGASEQLQNPQLQNQQSVSLQVGALQPGTFPNQHSVPLPLGAFQHFANSNNIGKPQ